MTTTINARASGAWRAADGVPVTIVSVAGRAATVELGEPAAGYKVGRTVTLPAAWITDDAPPAPPAATVEIDAAPVADPVMGSGAYFTPEAVCTTLGVRPTCGRPLP